MAVETLVREPVSFEDDQDEMEHLKGCEELARTAEATLGYNLLITKLPVFQEQAERRLSLKKAMSELGIEPFNLGAVEKYKAKMARRATPLATRVKEGIMTATLLLFWLAVVVLPASLVAFVICWSFEALITPSWLKVTFATSFLLGVAAFLILGVLAQQKVIYAEWDSIAIRMYNRPIPDFALQTAVDLKEKCREAGFFIEELELKGRTLDPFLVVFDSENNKYYLEVWNEPLFK